MGWTTTDLLARIRRDGRLSSNDPDYTDAVLLDIATGIMLDRFVPEIVAAREEYYDRYENATIVANQRAYAFSSRAFVSSLREVVFIASNGDQRALAPRSYMESHGYANRSAPEPEAYTVEDDKVVLLPTPNAASGTLRIVYEYRPGVLVATSAAMAITGGVGTGVLTGAEPGWTTANRFDIIKGTSPFALISADLTATAVVAATSVTFTLSTLDTTRLAIGDYVCLANKSCVPQIPAELHGALGQATAARVGEYTGDATVAPLEAHVSATLSRIRRLLSPRVRGRTQKWVNTGSPLRRGRGVAGRTWDDGLP